MTATLGATLNARHSAVELQFRLAAGEEVGDFFGRLISIGGVLFQQTIEDRAGLRPSAAPSVSNKLPTQFIRRGLQVNAWLLPVLADRQSQSTIPDCSLHVDSPLCPLFSNRCERCFAG